MPRDSQGVYSLPAGTIVNEGDTILPSQHNPAMEDLGQAISGSLSRDALGAMRAPLSMGGFKATNLAPGTTSTDAATFGQLDSIGVPIGAPMLWLTETPPSGYLLAYGQAISRTTYATLFARWGTRFGPGDGTTTFNMPDFRGVVAAGLDNMGGTAAGRLPGATALGVVLGAATVALSAGQMPVHSHGVSDPGHNHGYSGITGFGGIATGSGVGQATLGTDGNTTGITIQNAGSGEAHPNVQPTFALNIMIRVL